MELVTYLADRTLRGMHDRHASPLDALHVALAFRE
jgi:hypothetical protein